MVSRFSYFGTVEYPELHMGRFPPAWATVPARVTEKGGTRYYAIFAGSVGISTARDSVENDQLDEDPAADWLVVVQAQV